MRNPEAIASSVRFARYLLPAVFAVAVTSPGCSKPRQPSTTNTTPAKVELIPLETELATLTLTKDAVQRLGIQLEPVEQRRVARHRTLAGEAIVPPGKSIVVTAPVPGWIEPAGESFPLPGSEVSVAQSLMILRPMLSPERDVPTPAEQVQMTGAKASVMVALVTAQGDIARGQAEVQGLQITRDRAAQLLADRAGSRRALDDAEALLSVSKSALEAAKQRERELGALLQAIDDANKSGGRIDPASPLTLTAPMTGVVRNIQVSPGQNVTASVPLFEIVDLRTIWVRVPIYVDQLPHLRQDTTVKLVSLDGTPLSDLPQFAKPIAAPPTADAANSSADLYYEVDNRTLRLRPGQRVGVDMPLMTVTEALVVPDSAVLYDIYGGTWVYVESQGREGAQAKFMRHRVQLEWVDGDRAVLSQGPAIGSLVVTDGAAELFGTEFGAGK